MKTPQYEMKSKSVQQFWYCFTRTEGMKKQFNTSPANMPINTKIYITLYIEYIINTTAGKHSTC